MGVTVLHAYPVPTDKTAPQVINCKFGTFIALPAKGILYNNIWRMRQIEMVRFIK